MVKPALRRSWRDRQTVQFGIDPGRAAVLEGVDPVTERLLALLDGTLSLQRLRREAIRLGMRAERLDRLLELLRAGGVLDDAEAAAPLHRLPETTRERLRPDLSSLSIVHSAPGAAVGRLTARRRQVVQVRGAGRVGVSLASVLSAAGLGRVDVIDSGRVRPWDTAPCGTPAAETGRQRAAAARSAVKRAAVAPPVTAAGVDLVVFAPRDGLDALAPDPEEITPLVRAGVPHLFAGVMDGTGFAGPLFSPGAEGSGCGGCQWLHRVDTDPAWPVMLAQLRSGRPGPPPACDTALATTVAGLTAMHVLMFLDGGTPPSVGGRAELSLMDLSVTVRPLPRHPGCGQHEVGDRAGARKPVPSGTSRERVSGSAAAEHGHGCASVTGGAACTGDSQVTMVPG